MLTNNSNQFIDITDTVIKPNYKSPLTRFTKITRQMVKMLFNRIAYANEIWELNKHSIDYTENSSIRIDTSMYPPEIKELIETESHEYSQLTFNIGERRVIIYIGNEYKSSIDDIIKRMYMWLIIASFYADKPCSQTLTIYLSMTNSKKHLPNNSTDYIDRQHVNTAYTFPCKKNNEIHIFRKEEWFKVLIHETFHSFGLDFAAFDHKSTDKQILEIFNVVADVRIFESYCEMWAEFINNMFIIFFNTKWNTSIDKWADICIRKLEVLVYREQMFSMLQCAKLLSHFQLHYTDLLTNMTNSTTPNPKYRDKTHVLSYYIIKSILLYNINDFIEQCIDINGFSINFNKNVVNENMKVYCEMVKKLHNNPRYIAELSRMISLLSTPKYENLPNLYKESLYMSLHELG
jgi:hypothetical protein